MSKPLVIALLSCATCAAAATSDSVSSADPGARGTVAVERGKATWYGGKHHGGPTASGERFNKNAMTAAHKKLPFNSIVRVTNLKNGRAVTVRINDRGPYGKGRIIDVSEAAARKLNMIRSGVVPCTVEVIKLGEQRKRRKRRKRH